MEGHNQRKEREIIMFKFRLFRIFLLIFILLLLTTVSCQSNQGSITASENTKSGSFGSNASMAQKENSDSDYSDTDVEQNGLLNYTTLYYKGYVYFDLSNHIMRIKDIDKPVWDIPDNGSQCEKVFNPKKYITYPKYILPEDVKDYYDCSLITEIDKILICDDILYCDVIQHHDRNSNSDDEEAKKPLWIEEILSFDLNKKEFLNKITFSSYYSDDNINMFLDNGDLYIAEENRLASYDKELSIKKLYENGKPQDQWSKDGPWGRYAGPSWGYIEIEGGEIFQEFYYNGYVYFTVWESDLDHGTADYEGVFRYNIKTKKKEKIYEDEEVPDGFGYDGDTDVRIKNICNNKLYLQVYYDSDYETEDQFIPDAAKYCEIDLDTLSSKMIGIYECGKMNIVNGHIAWQN